MSPLPSPLTSPTPATIQSETTPPSAPEPTMLVPLSSHAATLPESWRHRMSALPSPSRSKTVASDPAPRDRSAHPIELPPSLLHHPPERRPRRSTPPALLTLN